MSTCLHTDCSYGSLVKQTPLPHMHPVPLVHVTYQIAGEIQHNFKCSHSTVDRKDTEKHPPYPS
uniref:Uncharacterized protein n=1 Tax=Arion vulgaris TaxID=1028688 RepID=A0A0B7BHR2_9EUPU